MRDTLAWLLDHANVIHQCGPGRHRGPVRALGAVARTMRGGLSPRAYVGAELPDVLALADVVISRNGTGTITELTALGKRSTWRPTAPP